MGKAQSKRSVDITTETKKGAEDEITEKMEKIEDLDKKEVLNGDAAIKEKSDPEKMDTEEVENDKDMTTEKTVDVQASGDSVESPTAESSKDEGVAAAAEEISPLADESIKKSKKEKVKKKWSFRSISFGKKDKQKPAKSEEAAEDGAPAVNGAVDDKASTEPEDSQKDKSSVNDIEEKSKESHENGNATQEELKLQQTEEKPSEDKSNITANTTNNTTTTETSDPVQHETAAVSETENIAVSAITINETKISENAVNNETSKNGNIVAEEINAIEPESQITDESVEAPTEKKSTTTDLKNESASTNGEVVEKIHQNGTYAESEPEVEQPKAKIEVNSNTDKVSAATLDSISSTSINPSNDQAHTQILNAFSENTDENIQINDEPSVKKSTDIEVKSHVITQSSPSGTTTDSLVNFDDECKQNETVVLLTTQTVDTEKPSDERIGDETSPPPLPISPPPSQVSVFAFTNTEESSEDSIQHKNTEPFTNTTINEEKDEIIIPPSSANENELSETKKQDKTIPPSVNENEISATSNYESETLDNIRPYKEEVEDVHINVQDNTENETNACKDLSLIKDDVLSTDLSDETQKEETSIAAAVIDEITEKAANIVNQQLTSSDECFLEIKNVITDEDKCFEENLNENVVSELDKTMQIDIDNKQEQEHKDDKEFFCEITNKSKEFLVALEPTDSTCNESSLQISAPAGSMQQTQDEMIFLNMSDNVDDEHFDPTKEFANAKDLKENIAVAEITQDLSVTCE